MRPFINKILSLLKENKRSVSRKYKLALLILIIASIICAVPPIVSVFFLKLATPLIILSGSEFVTIISLIAATYMAANVSQKKMTNNKLPENQEIPPNSPPEQ